MSMKGRILSHYRIVDNVGQGGMGIVYKAEDTELGRTVAIKALPPEQTRDAARCARFLHEARSASALNHPHIVTIYDLVREGDEQFLVMEFLEGRTLEQILHQRGLPVTEALRLGSQIADALAAAHASGIAHRDLKPSNVMVSPVNNVKLLDFGLARLMETQPSTPDNLTRTAGCTEEGPSLALLLTCLPNRPREDRWTRAPTSSASARCYTRW